jgi:hypothetical protein
MDRFLGDVLWDATVKLSQGRDGSFEGFGIHRLRGFWF